MLVRAEQGGRWAGRSWRALALLGCLAAGLLGLPVAAEGSSAELRAPVLRPAGRELRVSLRLEGPLGDEIEARIASGLEVSFEYTVRLRKKRSRFLDKTVSERYVTVSVQYSNLTKMYKISRRIDGTVTDFDITDQAGFMNAWMTELEDLSLFDARDFDGAGFYYVRARVRLLSRFRLLVLPWDLESGWTESIPISRDEAGVLAAADDSADLP